MRTHRFNLAIFRHILTTTAASPASQVMAESNARDCGESCMRAVSKALGAIIAAAALAAAGPAVAATATTAASAAPSAVAADSPSGFMYGTDSWPATALLSNPYREPALWGPYGGYMGMAGNWARTEGCKTGNFLAWAPANSAQANVNYTKYHVGIGTGVDWYMGGPGVDPHWNGTTTEAFRWGVRQGAWA